MQMVRMRSRTSVANSGVKEATTYSYIVFCTEILILRVANWASTWANQMWGSAGQKGGSLMLAAAMVTGLPSAGVGDGCLPRATGLTLKHPWKLASGTPIFVCEGR